MTALSAALSLGPAHAWEWVDLPVRLGVWGGLGLAVIALPASRRVCTVLLLLVLVLHLSILNQAPTNVYFAQTLQAWEQGASSASTDWVSGSAGSGLTSHWRM